MWSGAPKEVYSIVIEGLGREPMIRCRVSVRLWEAAM